MTMKNPVRILSAACALLIAALAASVIVNIMLEELRDYYSLEDIWSGCSKIDVTPYIQ